MKLRIIALGVALAASTPVLATVQDADFLFVSATGNITCLDVITAPAKPNTGEYARAFLTLSQYSYQDNAKMSKALTRLNDEPEEFGSAIGYFCAKHKDMLYREALIIFFDHLALLNGVRE